MSNDIRDIIERLAILEGRVTPTTVKSGLNPEQKSVPQLPALFKPKHISVLGAKTDPEHPMHDYAVGASESIEVEEAVVQNKNLSIHDPESERFANPGKEAEVNVDAKKAAMNLPNPPGWAAGYPNTNNVNKSSTSSSSSGPTVTPATASGVKDQPEKYMGPVQTAFPQLKELDKQTPPVAPLSDYEKLTSPAGRAQRSNELGELLKNAGVKEGNIPDYFPSKTEVSKYADYTRQMQKEFGTDWKPDPEPGKQTPPVAPLSDYEKLTSPAGQAQRRNAGVKEGNIPDYFPSKTEVSKYADYTRQMQKEFGTDWKPDPEPIKPYNTKNVEESHMSNIDQLMQDIGTGEVDIYDIYANPKTPEEEYASKIVNRMYDDVTINHGLHPDDQFEEILDIVADQIAQDYPADELNESLANEEKLLDKVKKSLTDYLTSIEDKYRDDNISKKAQDKDLGERAKDRDLVSKEVNEDPTEEEPANTDQVPTAPVVNPTYSEPSPGAVKTYTMEDGRVCEIHGDEATGFEIRHGNRSMPSRFKNIDEASLALEMYQARCRARNQSNDYIDEA